MTVTAVPPAVRGLVWGLVDYAGLFPPAGLPMPAAVANYAAYHASDDSWALGRFVVPAARLAEFEDAAATVGAGTGANPWTVSLLVASPAELSVVVPFNARWAGRIVIDAIEGKAGSVEQVGSLAAARPAGTELFVELVVGPALAATLGEVRRVGASAKIRAGGTTPEAFPAVDDVVAFLRACHAARVPFKATAGLHHPVRGLYRLTYAPDSPVGTMHGYLNVLVAAEAIANGGTDADAQRVMLAESAHDLVITDDRIAWAG
ncbi:MAG: hypothetical protein H7066_21740, partial [Cytophagaceae bacterium]|nr:hypothetical protein [Gemmatimonadaceae bacterium]